MSIMDEYLELSDAQQVCNAGTTEESTVQLDLGAANALGEGTPLFLNVTVNTTFTDCSTLQVHLQDGAADDSFSTVLSTAAIPVADLTAGKELLKISLPTTLRRYIRLNYEIDSGTESAGKVDAWIDMGPQSNVRDEAD